MLPLEHYLIMAVNADLALVLDNREQLGSYAADRPNVCGWRVVWLHENDFWGSIISSDDVIRKATTSLSYFIFVVFLGRTTRKRPGEAEVAQLQLATLCNEKISRLNISVNNVSTVEILGATEHVVYGVLEALSAKLFRVDPHHFIVQVARL